MRRRDRRIISSCVALSLCTRTASSIAACSMRPRCARVRAPVGRPMPRCCFAQHQPANQISVRVGLEISLFRPNIQPQGGESAGRTVTAHRAIADRSSAAPRTASPAVGQATKGLIGARTAQGPMFKDTNKGPDGRPDLRDGKKDGKAGRARPSHRAAPARPFGTQGQGNQGQGNQGQGLYKARRTTTRPSSHSSRKVKGQIIGQGPGSRRWREGGSGPLPSGQNQPTFGPPQSFVQDQRPPSLPNSTKGGLRRSLSRRAQGRKEGRQERSSGFLVLTCPGGPPSGTARPHFFTGWLRGAGEHAEGQVLQTTSAISPPFWCACARGAPRHLTRRH
jgi:hypothetical protein